MDLYIYYHAAVSDAPAIVAEVSTLQRLLVASHAVQGALKRRPEPDDGRHTWMEVYHAVPDDFTQHLDSMLTKTLLLRLIDGARHAEYFLDCPPCA